MHLTDSHVQILTPESEVNWSMALAVSTAERSVKLWDLCRGRCFLLADIPSRRRAFPLIDG